MFENRYDIAHKLLLAAFIFLALYSIMQIAAGDIRGPVYNGTGFGT